LMTTTFPFRRSSYNRTLFPAWVFSTTLGKRSAKGSRALSTVSAGAAVARVGRARGAPAPRAAATTATETMADLGLRNAGDIVAHDLPEQHHGVVLVDRVVAVHEIGRASCRERGWVAGCGGVRR